MGLLERRLGAGGNGAAAASSVNQGATPTVNAVGPAVTVSWAATTLANGQAVTGYLVKRYDAGTLAPQTILSACTGTITATTCVESGVPNGSWEYTVTPVFATNWQGVESERERHGHRRQHRTHQRHLALRRSPAAPS